MTPPWQLALVPLRVHHFLQRPPPPPISDGRLRTTSQGWPTVRTAASSGSHHRFISLPFLLRWCGRPSSDIVARTHTHTHTHTRPTPQALVAGSNARRMAQHRRHHELTHCPRQAATTWPRSPTWAIPLWAVQVLQTRVRECPPLQVKSLLPRKSWLWARSHQWSTPTVCPQWPSSTRGAPSPPLP
jgi:hypothetical protein